jgi:hypothetical protein
MSIYSLTHPETWALATLFHLPIQPGSVLAGWLANNPIPSESSYSDQALISLAAKGYYYGEQAAQPFPAGLLASLTLASVNAAELISIIRTGSKAALVRFAQAGTGILQYGADERHLSLHNVTQMSELARTLLPNWFTVTNNENLWANLPLGAFLLFKHACALSDWANARSGFIEQDFSRQELLESFQRSTAWVDIFNDIGLKGTQTLEKMPLEEYLGQLITRDYLTSKNGDMLELSPGGKPLAAVFSDPDLCTLTLSLLNWEDTQLESSAFLYGAGRLFLVTFSEGRVAIQQCASLESAQVWVKDLLNKGCQAHYTHYQIPPLPKAAPKPAPAAPVPHPVPAAAARPGPAPIPVVQQAGFTPPAPAAPPANQPPSTAWFYMDRGAQVGPVDESILRDWLYRQSISLNTLVWNPTLPGWMEIGQTWLMQPKTPAVYACPRCGIALKPGLPYCERCGYRL